MLGIKVKTFDVWRRLLKVPTPDLVVGSNTVLWEKSKIHEWLKQRESALLERMAKLVDQGKMSAEPKTPDRPGILEFETEFGQKANLIEVAPNIASFLSNHNISYEYFNPGASQALSALLLALGDKYARWTQNSTWGNEFRLLYLPYVAQLLSNGRWLLLNRGYKPLGVGERMGWIDYEHYSALSVELDTRFVLLKRDDETMYLYDDGCIPGRDASRFYGTPGIHAGKMVYCTRVLGALGMIAEDGNIKPNASTMNRVEAQRHQREEQQ
jgi:hypothetical protein